MHKTNCDWMPNNLGAEIGQFNVFTLAPYVGDKAKPIPYKRRDFYKIMLVIGKSKVHFADKIIEVKKRALTFSNPQIPYKWVHEDEDRKGYFCIFNQHFFHQFGVLNHYSVFQPTGTHIFELTDEQEEQVKKIFEKMMEEIKSEYIHKYDVLRNLVYELLHIAMKTQPSTAYEKKLINASQRITSLFLELLERQFPIDEIHQKIQLKTANAFAMQLNVHVNHLNKALKEITTQSTTQIIAQRILQEAKLLLKHSTWSVAEIAFALGFNEVTHFNNFFKKNLLLSPLKFRNNTM